MRIKRKSIRRIYTPNSEFEYTIEKNNISRFKELLSNPEVNPASNRSYSIRAATSLNNYTMVKMLLEDGRADPTEMINYCVKAASEKGYVKILKLLLKDNRVDPTSDENYALESAINNEKEKSIDILLSDKRVKVTENNYACFKIAVERLDCDLVRKLKKKGRITSKERLMYFFNIAINNDNNELADLLYSSLIKEEVKNKYPKYFNKKEMQNKMSIF